MNKPLMDNTVSPYRTFVVLLFLVAAASFVVTSPALAAPTIQWSQAGVTSSVTQGSSKTVSVSFVSTEDLSNVSVSIVPALVPYVSASPSSFGSIRAGGPVTVNLTFSAPGSATVGTVDGTLHLRDSGQSRRTYARLSLRALRTSERGRELVRVEARLLVNAVSPRQADACS